MLLGAFVFDPIKDPYAEKEEVIIV